MADSTPFKETLEMFKDPRHLKHHNNEINRLLYCTFKLMKANITKNTPTIINGYINKFFKMIF